MSGLLAALVRRGGQQATSVRLPARPGNRPPLLHPPHRQRPLQPLQHHPLVRPPAEDRLDDVRRQQRQPQDAADVALPDLLRLGDLGHRAVDAAVQQFMPPPGARQLRDQHPVRCDWVGGVSSLPAAAVPVLARQIMDPARARLAWLTRPAWLRRVARFALRLAARTGQPGTECGHELFAREGDGREPSSLRSNPVSSISIGSSRSPPLLSVTVSDPSSSPGTRFTDSHSRGFDHRLRSRCSLASTMEAEA